MKFMICFLISLCFVDVASAQSSLLKKPTLVVEAVQPVFTSAYEENWSTTTFNPYKNEPPVQFPLEIDFTNQHFEMPVIGITTSRYGWRKGQPHKGIDIDLETGDIVKTVMDGKVRFAKYYSGFGNVVVVRHSNGLETIYAHLSKILVKPNEDVFAGFAIGLGGNTGKSTGSHLHFEVRYRNVPINPEYLFDLDGTQQLQTNHKILVTEYWTQPNKHRSTKQSNIVIHKPVFEVKEDEHVHHVPLQHNSIVIHRSEPANKFIKSTTSGTGLKKNTTAHSVQKVTVVPQRKTHIIQQGENFRTIAQKYKTTIEKLCTLNGLSRTSSIKVGQIIYIPH